MLYGSGIHDISFFGILNSVQVMNIGIKVLFRNKICGKI